MTRTILSREAVVALVVLVVLAGACGSPPKAPPPDPKPRVDPPPVSRLEVREPATLETLRREILVAYVRARTAARLEQVEREIVFDPRARCVRVGLPDEPRLEIRYPAGVEQRTPRVRVRLRIDGSVGVRPTAAARASRHDVVLAAEGRAVAIDVQVDGVIRPTILQGG